MVQSVELLLDPSLVRAVRGEWQTLWGAGMPSLNRVTAESNRPHITLFVARSIPTEMDEALKYALSAPELPIRLGGYLVFGRTHVTLARSVAPSRSLLSLHRRVWETAAVKERGLDVPAHIAPGQWTPHVTLSRRLPSAELGLAVRLLGGSELSGYGTVLRRWDGDAKREWNLTPPAAW